MTWLKEIFWKQCDGGFGNSRNNRLAVQRITLKPVRENDKCHCCM